MTAEIVQQIRTAISDNTNGRGPDVIGTDCNTCTHRIINVRVKGGIVQGKKLSTGEWINLAACNVI